VAVDQSPQLRSGHVELFGELGLVEIVGAAVGDKSKCEALLDPDGCCDPWFDPGPDFGVVGVPRPGLGEHVPGHVGPMSVSPTSDSPSAEAMARLERYTPDCLPAGQWALAGETVKAAVLAAEPVDAEDAKGLVSRLCLFLVGPCGWDRSRGPDLVALLGRDGRPPRESSGGSAGDFFSGSDARRVPRPVRRCGGGVGAEAGGPLRSDDL